MIKTERKDGLWIATIDRQDKANSLTGAMLNQLADFAEEAAGEARVLVLTGKGKVFSAGADLEEARAGLATDPVWERLSGAIAACPCLTIAVLNGTLAGGAFGMALACDLRIAAPSAKFFYPVMKLGFLPQPSDPARLTRLVGPARAKMILMAGQKLPAEVAMGYGLIDEICPAERLMERVGELADHPLSATAEHVGTIKAMIG